MYHDLLGMMQHPHHAKVTPKFCKQYAAVGQVHTGGCASRGQNRRLNGIPVCIFADCCSQHEDRWADLQSNLRIS